MDIKRIKNKTERVLEPIVAVLDQISMLILFSMMILTVANVILRKFSKSIIGTEEITQLMMACMIYFSFAMTELKDGHIRVDTLVKFLKPKTRAKLDVFTQILCLILFIILTVAAYVHAGGVRLSGEVTMLLYIPVYPFIYIVSLGFAFVCLSLIIKIFAAISEVIEL